MTLRYYIFVLVMIGSSCTGQTSKVIECDYKTVMVGEVEICLPEIMDYKFYPPDSVVGMIEQPVATILGYYFTKENSTGDDLYNMIKVYYANSFKDEHFTEAEFERYAITNKEMTESPTFDIREIMEIPDFIRIDKPVVIDYRSVNAYYFYFVFLNRSNQYDEVYATVASTILIKGRVLNLAHRIRYESLEKLKEQLSLDEYIVRRIHEINL